MLLRRITDYILQSRLQAMGVAFVCAFIPWVGTISIVITAFVTLRKGAREGALVLLAATVPIIVGYLLYPADSQTTSSILSDVNIMLIMIIGNVLTWLFAVLLRRYSNWGLVLQVAAGLSIVTVFGVHLLYPDVQNWWGTELKSYFAQTMQAMDQMQANDVNGADALARIVEGVKPYATGGIVVFVVFNALLQVLIGRWWQAAMFNPGGLRKELYHVRLSQVGGLVFIVGLVFAYWGSETIVDIMPVLYLTFSLAGLSLLHDIVTLSKTAWFWLALVYIGIMIFPMSLAVIAIVALVDTWVDFRKRLKLQS